MTKPRNVISIKNVNKHFILPHEKNNSVKSLFTTIFTKRGNATKQIALKNINIDINEGEFFGIVGRNGSGKSTLLKIIAGIYQPTTGIVKVHGKLVPFIELGVGFNPELTGRENVYLNGAMLGFNRNHIESNYSKIVEFAELEDFMDQKLKNYSSGMQVRLAFACATMAEADILLVDEVLAVGDAEFQRKCFEYFRKLKKLKKTVVFVSHDMGAVKEYCDRAVLIEENVIVKSGKVSTVASAYNKLFIPKEELGEKADKINLTRWGDKTITYSNVKINKSTITQDDDYVIITAEYNINNDVTSPVFGFSIRNSGGTYICGTNTKLIDQKTGIYKKGAKGTIVWKMVNIFNNGEYILDIAVSNKDESTQYDWWEDVDDFSVYRSKHTSYAVEPPIGVEIIE